MLRHLSIQNYALLDELEIDFPEGLNIITGETGAGKSILLGALSLVLGSRADTQSLLDKSKKCIIEGIFELDEKKMKDFFEENQLDFERKTIIRREINPEGKSRAFINDTPVNLNVLKELSTSIIDIHSQHETLQLNNREFQLSVVDAFAGCIAELTEYKLQYKEYRKKMQELNELEEKERQARKELDYFSFQFKELEEASLKRGEQTGIEQELETLNNSEEIRLKLSESVYGLHGGEKNLVSILNGIRNTTSALAHYNPEIQKLNERLNSVYIELKDIASEMETLEQKTSYDPKRMEVLNARLDTIYRLQNKHGVKFVEELLDIQEALGKKLTEFSSLEDSIKKTKKELEILKAQIDKQASLLSAKRKKAVPALEKEIQSLLTSLAMPNARLEVQHSPLEEVGPSGTDSIDFFFTANKGSEARELNKVASGGELSRLMLAIKSIVAKKKSLPTIIFDEIDTGISGDVAAKVGAIMEGIASSIQVISITHLPQIASKGDTHFFVYKEIKKDKTYSRIKLLNKSERVEEIARMLSAGAPTQAAIRNAKELLEN